VRAYCSFLRRIQYRPGAWTNDDFRGHYGFPVLAPPPAGATSSATEAALSTYALAEHHGVRDREIREQVVIALDALVRDQIRADNSWLMPNPDAAAGGIRRSLVEQDVRIDFTQHAASALVRGAQLLRDDGRE
jgi:hypothetical protein